MRIEDAATIEGGRLGASDSFAPNAAVKVLGAVFSYRVMLAFGLAVITVLTVSSRFNDPDLWWHLKAGEIVWNTHSAPSTDSFSFTAFGRSSTEHEWIAQWSIYAAYRAAGYTGLMVWLAGLSSILFILVYIRCYLVTRNALVAFLGGVCAWFFGTVSLAIRPLILGHIFLAAELILLELAARNRRWLWFLPPLFGLWVNCHGSYFFGLGVLFVYWLCSHFKGEWGFLVVETGERQTRRSLGVILIVSGIALCLNPVGIHVFLYPLKVLFQQSTSMNAIDEWLPPDLRSSRGIGLIVAMMGILVLCLLRRSNLYVRELLVLGAAFALALLHVRMAFVFGIVVSPALCRLISPLLEERRRRDHPIANGLLVFSFVAAMMWSWPGVAEIQGQIQRANPVRAVAHIERAGLAGPMVNEYRFGAYLIWAAPQHKVFIDGRGDIYDPTGILAEYGRWATLGEDPKVMLEKYHIRLCLLSKDAPMARVLPYLPGWRKTYSDDVAAVFAR